MREAASVGDLFHFSVQSVATALNALAARLEKAGIAVRRESAVVADQRCAAEVISFRDPAGNCVEAIHGAQIASLAPMPPGCAVLPCCMENAMGMQLVPQEQTAGLGELARNPFSRWVSRDAQP